MNNFISTVLSTAVEKNSVAVFFLGQAGFLIKTDSGKLLAIDPYLSNCCERFFGFKRLMPQIVTADELNLDYLVVSHAHYDHFDPDSVPTLLGNKTKFIGAKDTLVEIERLQLKGDITTLKVGEVYNDGEIKITAVPCDHGELAPDAIGLLIEISGKKIYYMGDTAYREDLISSPLFTSVDLLLLPINGAFGNLNEYEASKVCSVIKPKLAVPCHYWNFAEHGGNPNIFQTEMKTNYKDINFILMRQGEKIILK